MTQHQLELANHRRTVRAMQTTDWPAIAIVTVVGIALLICGALFVPGFRCGDLPAGAQHQCQ